ncbi:MAG: outer membrane protein transport protein [Muribaculaceae bacterium]|nr:outer membrane protein transport protein [Muribaculaceae bacterium]
MKKIVRAFTLALMCGCTLMASAEGYQVNTLSARQNGMGHTGVAQKLGSESMIFNPAGMAFMDHTVDFSGSVTGVFADATATLPDGSKYSTSNTPSTPMAFNLGMSVYRNLKAGVSFYTPYGSGINWGENWPGAVLNQSVNLKAFTVQPTVAWRIIPNLSIGAGVMVTWGTVDLNKGLVSASSFNALLSSMGSAWPTSDTPASINLTGKANVAVGVNAGILWDINSKVSVGASFRSEMKLKVEKGEAAVSYASDAAEILQNQLGILNQANFAASMPCPAVFNIGVGYRPIKKLLLAFDAQFTAWSAYKSLDIEFLSEKLTPFNQYIDKKYRDAWTFKIGGQYSLTERFDLRLGLMFDTTPVRKEYYNPETPGMTKISPSVGFSFSPVKYLSIDAALLYVAGLGIDNASVSYPDLLAGTTRTFTADYKVHAWNPSIGVSLHF